MSESSSPPSEPSARKRDRAEYMRRWREGKPTFYLRCQSEAELEVMRKLLVKYRERTKGG